MAFECVMEVRDYECDLADGVNNSVYMNYLEHAHADGRPRMPAELEPLILALCEM